MNLHRTTTTETLPAAAPAPTTEADAIETATVCTCGAHVVVLSFHHEWLARCGECYDGTEDAASSARVRGLGPTPAAALSAYLEASEDAGMLRYLPTSLGWRAATSAALEA
jgi:hypothetical protein